MLRRLTNWLNHRGVDRASTPPSVEPWAAPFTGIATQADILHCFRLLLGRHPHREEWAGHSGRAGEELEGLVAGYLRSLEFTRRGLLSEPASKKLAQVQLDGFAIYVAPDDLDVGRHVQFDRYEPDVTAVFRRLLQPGMAVVDIGANIGDRCTSKWQYRPVAIMCLRHTAKTSTTIGLFSSGVR